MPKAAKTWFSSKVDIWGSVSRRSGGQGGQGQGVRGQGSGFGVWVSKMKNTFVESRARRCEQIHLSRSTFKKGADAHSQSASHMMLHAHAWLKFKLCFPHNSHSISCAMSHAMHGTRSTYSSSFSSVPSLQRLLTSRKPCAGPREHGGEGYDLLGPSPT